MAVPQAPDDGLGDFAPAASAPSEGYVRYVLLTLMVVYAFNFVDRQIINILAEPIKTELGLMDWQIGLMSGLAFALFYTILGVPIARIADRGHRPMIISISLAAWSGFTVLCGLSQNFLHLCLARIGVGVGEAGCTPTAHSLISDYVAPAKRASALALYSMGVPIGGLVGMAMGGIVADAYGWRIAFFVAGAPGLLLAVVTALTLRETRTFVKHASRPPQPTFLQALTLLSSKRTFWLLSFAAAVNAFISYGHAPFTASFFLRNHSEEVAVLAAQFGLKPVGFLGLTLGLISGIFGAFSSFAGGWIADRHAVRDPSRAMSAPAIAALLTVPTYIAAMLVGSAQLALAILVVPAFLAYFWYGPGYAAMQGIVPPHTRATAVALLFFIANLIGLGLGPVLVGAMSDAFSDLLRLGPAEGVRWAQIVSSLFGVIPAVLFWKARRTLRHDLEA